MAGSSGYLHDGGLSVRVSPYEYRVNRFGFVPRRRTLAVHGEALRVEHDRLEQDRFAVEPEILIEPEEDRRNQERAPVARNEIETHDAVGRLEPRAPLREIRL